MKLFIKIISITLLLLIVGGVLLFNLYKEPLEHKIPGKLERLISLKTGRPVKIRAFEINSINSFTIRQLEIFSRDRKNIIFGAGTLEITLDPSPLISSGQVNIIIKYDKTSLKDYYSGASGTLLITTNGIMDLIASQAIAPIRHLHLKSEQFWMPGVGAIGDDPGEEFTIKATISPEGKNIDSMKLGLRYNDLPYYFHITRNILSPDTYSIELRYDGVSMKGTAIRKAGDLSIDNTSGTLYSMPFSLSAEIKNFLNPSRSIIEAEAKLDTEVQNMTAFRKNAKKMLFLPGKLGKFIPAVEKLSYIVDKHKIQGKLHSTLRVIGAGYKIKENVLYGDLKISSLSFSDVPLGNISGKYTIQRSKCEFTEITSDAFGSETQGQLFLDLRSVAIPYKLELNTSGANLSEISSTLSKGKYIIPGELNIYLSLTGDLVWPDDSKGICLVRAENVAFEKIPGVKRLLKNYNTPYSPRHTTSLKSATGQFDISSHRASTSAFTIEGPELHISASGSIDLRGDMSFKFTNTFTPRGNLPPEAASHMPRSAILTGNIRNPKWSLQ